MRFLYSCLVEVLRPVAFAVVLWRGLRDRGYWEGLGERFGFGRATAPDATAVDGTAADAAPVSVWVHAVSLGEVTAAAPLIRALHTGRTGMIITLTTATPTGRARARDLLGRSIDVRFMPYDTPGGMRRLLERLRPRLVIIMETELWPNLFHECRRRRIPVVLANARVSPKSVRRYRHFGTLFRSLFAGDAWVAAQSAEDAARFMELGANRDRTQVIGNIKFDVPSNAATLERGRALRAENWNDRPVWVAGSTHAGEEEELLTAHAAVREDVDGALLLLVPRHPQRFAAVAELLLRRGMSFERRSTGGVPRPETQVLLVDTVGDLSMLYAAADVAFVGGSLVPIGGHNLLEPAALSVPVITGPSYENGLEIAELLLKEGGALAVADASELAAVLKQLLVDPERRQRVGARARQVVEANRGSLARLMRLLEPMLAGEAGTPGGSAGRSPPISAGH